MRVVAWSLVLTLVACRSSDSDADLLKRVSDNESSLEALTSRLDAVETQVDALDVLVGGGEGEGLTEALAALQEDITDLQEDVSGQATDLGMQAEEIHQLSDEIAELRSDVNANDVDIATNASDIAAVTADYLTSVDQAALQAEIDDNESGVNGNSTGFAALTAAVAGNTTSISTTNATLAVVTGDYLTSTEQAALQLDIATNATDIATNAADITANSGALSGVTSDYLTSTEQSALQGGIDANLVSVQSVQTDVTSIQTDYLPWIDGVSTYLDANTSLGVVSVSGANLVVDNQIYGESLAFRECNNTAYDCTPLECLALCQANGERMAFTDEVLAWASEGQDSCAWKWMLERNANASETFPVRAYPMYFNRTTNSGCGAQNTGDVPRLGGYSDEGASMSTWNSTATYDCACASLN